MIVNPSPLSFNQALVVDVLGAILAHIWFNRYEPKLDQQFLISILSIPLLTSSLFLPHLSPLKAFAVAHVIFYTSLVLSIAIYRLSPFHPLAKYPGPILGRISQLWTAWNALDGKFHLYMRRMHEKYGPIVRIGPNQLSITDMDLIPSIMGVQGLPKGPLWEGRRITPSKNRAQISLISSRDMKQHALLRKPWNNAFSTASMKDYEEILIGRAVQFIESIEKICDDGWTNVDIAKLISYFTFDFMGDLAFGSGFDLMSKGDVDGIWQRMQQGLKIPGISQHIPWSSHILRALPFFANSTRAFGSFAVQKAKIRSDEVQSGKNVRRDLFFHLLSASSTSPDPKIRSAATPFPVIVSNAVLTIIAGSDTTASALSNAVYFLIKYPEVLERLREELIETFGKPGERLDAMTLDVQKLSEMKYLNAILNETLRLLPVLPTCLQRSPADGSGGKLIGSFFIPEGTAVMIPLYVLHRSPKYFSPNPDQFWPDRWLLADANHNANSESTSAASSLSSATSPKSTAECRSEDEIILNRAAFMPFSSGPMNCVGKPLAQMELRLLLAMLVLRFDIRRPDNDDKWMRWEDGLKDYFVMVKGELGVQVKKRK